MIRDSKLGEAREWLVRGLGRDPLNLDVDEVAVTDETIMADGRPAHAWWAEITMLRQEVEQLKGAGDVANDKMRAMRIAEICSWNAYESMELHIKISNLDRMRAVNWDNPEKYAQVVSHTKRTPEALSSEPTSESGQTDAKDTPNSRSTKDGE